MKLEEDLENSRVNYDCVEELKDKQRKSENDEETIAGLVEEMSSLKSEKSYLRDKLAESN